LSLLALSPEADRDIKETVRYLRDHAGVEKARGFVAALRATGELLTSHPEVGRLYRKTQTGIKVRALPVKHFGDWLLFYEVVEGEAQTVIFIHRLLHGSRDIEALLH
jgi:plasmid stabilization system protein ParE